ncbi:MAG: PQQ-dependent sugar dehydrogenase [Sphingobacteriaceae bacterium]|nr:PQQ-dependent sugar dehydrogenase [Sphingobacteriaceae bacterium]
MRQAIILIIFLIGLIGATQAQSFIRSELSTTLTTPWELTYGPDNYLWITEAGGVVSKVDPANGNKTIVYTASDYFNGDVSEKLALCHQPDIQKGTLGLALHPQFLNPATAFIYFVHSYNSNTLTPSTKFKIRRLKWDHGTSQVVSDTTIVNDLPNGYDHIGGRLLAVRQGTNDYLIFSTGDNGISEVNAPTCYTPQINNPNNYVQDVNYKNGKIHRFNLDGSIPIDNPVSGNSMYTRGHRNPQGLAYNPSTGILYEIEHGDRTDDEINILEKGKNYGWKNVRGYHADNNYPGESAFVSSYTLTPGINGDGLKEAFYSWCATSQPTTSVYADWCTVAPSDGIYYNSSGIPGWNNSILVVTLKNGLTTDMEMYKFQLSIDGMSLVPSTTLNPNPSKFFGADQAQNGRLRDIAYSTDGKKIYLINNGGADRDKISVYTLDPNPGFNELEILNQALRCYPNPVSEQLSIRCSYPIHEIKVVDLMGRSIYSSMREFDSINTTGFGQGTYLLSVKLENGGVLHKRFMVMSR